MKRGLKEALGTALLLGLIGLLAGGVGGLAGAIFADTPDGAAQVAQVFYLALAGLCPLALVGLAHSNLHRGAHAAYTGPGGPFPVLILAGLGGAIIASALFLIPATNMPSIVDAEDPVVVRQALYDIIGLANFAVVVVASTVGGLVAAVQTARALR